MSWLDDLILQHRELESPQSFWKWSALAAISAAIKDNVWFDKQIYKLYPNIYVMLHADSGLKKGPPISMAKKLAQAAGVRVIQGRSSIQGILKEMGTARTNPGGMIENNSAVFICSSELSSSIVEDSAAMDILTDLYDRHYNEGDWKSLLKMESFSLKNATITILAGTNEAHSEEFFQKKDVQGGYFARTFVIYESKRNKINSLMFELDNKPDYVKSGLYIKELAKLRGEFKADFSVRNLFNDWYIAFCEARDLQGVKDATGTLNRFDDSVLKVAMLLALGREQGLVISREIIEEAIGMCEKLVGSVRKATMGQGKSQFAQHKAMIIQELLARDNHIISREQLNKKFYLHGSHEEWDTIMGSLEVAGFVKAKNMGTQIIWEMPVRIVTEMKRHLEGK